MVDSAPLIYLLDGHPVFALVFEGLFEAYERGVVRIALSTIAVAEGLAGSFKHGQEALAKRYEKVLVDFELVPVSQDIAATAARLRAGTELRLPDALQAATALEVGAAALVTHDRNFSRLTGLRVIVGDGAEFSRMAARA